MKRKNSDSIRGNGILVGVFTALVVFFTCLGLGGILFLLIVIGLFLLAYHLHQTYELFNTPYHYGVILAYLIPLMLTLLGGYYYIQNYMNTKAFCENIAMKVSSYINIKGPKKGKRDIEPNPSGILLDGIQSDSSTSGSSK